MAEKSDWTAILSAFLVGVAGAIQVGRVAPVASALQEDLHLDLSTLGWLVSLITLASALLGLMMGHWVIQAGLRRSIFAGAMLMGVCAVVSALAQSLPVLIGARIAEGVGYLVVVVAAPTLIAREAAAKDMPFALAVWGTFFTLGLSISAIAGGAVLELIGWRGWFIASAGLVVVAALAARLSMPADTLRTGARPRFRTILREWLPIKLKADLAGYSMWMTNAGVFAIGTMLAFGLGGWLWLKGAVTLGTVYLIYNYTELLRDPIAQLRHQLTELQQAEASIKRINTLLTTSTRLADGPQPDHVLPTGPLAVELTNVAFSYADEPDEKVLDDLTFTLQPGRVLGLLGRTGSGKSTLARLLLRLYDPTGGTLRVGGIEPSAVPLAAYRRRVGMVTQDVQLFQASVRDNLTFFDPTIPDAHIEEVLVDLGLGPWLHGLPSGLQSELAAGGAGLSAGQAQLLALARIFLTDPGLVIMDEASSRLDPATEMLLERAIDKLLYNRTAILIAHRLGTVQRADEILILEQGRIIEHDDRIVLAARPESRFAQLLRTGMAEVLA